MSQSPNTNPRLDERVQRALNKIKKPGTAEEITELVNRDLGAEDRPFQVGEVSENIFLDHRQQMIPYPLRYSILLIFNL
jgi:hypothetical protein